MDYVLNIKHGWRDLEIATISLRFQGIKHLKTERKDDPSIAEIWEEVFESDYRMPKCPDCKKLMRLKQLNVERGINVQYSLGSTISIPIPTDERIDVTFECDCGVEMEGLGRGMMIYPNQRCTLEEFIWINLRRVIR